jgi:transcriptional regulator with XRE-family HTH domain
MKHKMNDKIEINHPLYGPCTVSLAAELSKLAGQFRHARKNSGLTQIALADTLGLHPRTISFFERGESVMNLSTLMSALLAMGYTLTVVPASLIPKSAGTGEVLAERKEMGAGTV